MNHPRIITSISVVFKEESQVAKVSAHSGGKAIETAQDLDAKKLQEERNKVKASSDEEKDSLRSGCSKHSIASYEEKPNDE